MKKLTLDELGRISTDDYKKAKKLPLTIVLDNIRSLHNVGSAFRTADAFLIEKIILTGITGRPPHREIQKTALGATESVPWEYVESPAVAVSRLKSLGYAIAVVEQTTESISLENFFVEKDRKYALIFGNEVDGVSEELIGLADLAIEIPQGGSKHSLNVSVCLGIVSWHFFGSVRLSGDWSKH
jgi:23S rRNA (guanosine2251-2'-O)-methyltransferase